MLQKLQKNPIIIIIYACTENNQKDYCALILNYFMKKQSISAPIFMGSLSLKTQQYKSSKDNKFR